METCNVTILAIFENWYDLQNLVQTWCKVACVVTSEKGSKLETEVCTQANETRIAKRIIFERWHDHLRLGSRSTTAIKKASTLMVVAKTSRTRNTVDISLNTTSAQQEDNIYLQGMN